MKKMQGPQFLSEYDLVNRLSSSLKHKQKVVFLLGSGVVLPDQNGIGVPGATEVLKIMQGKFSPLLDECSSYQEAFKKLIRAEGQTAANRVIQQITLMARKDFKSFQNDDSIYQEGSLRRLENDLDPWSTPPSLRALSALCAHFPEKFGSTILTTNFDPLIEIALSKFRVPWYSTSLSEDGSLLNVRGVGTHVVHLHGLWRGVDTLHTSSQLIKTRSELRGSIRRLLEGCVLVVIGYGGWKDILMNTLGEVLAERATELELLWCFYQDDESAIKNNYSHVMALSRKASMNRVHFYKGIDSNSLLFKAADETLSMKPAQDLLTFFSRVELARLHAVDYSGFQSPWGTPRTSLGTYLPELVKFGDKLAPQVALIAVEYILALIVERQPPHSAPRDGEYTYIRSAVKKAHLFLKSGENDYSTAILLRETVEKIKIDIESGGEIRLALEAAALSIVSSLAFVSKDFSDGLLNYNYSATTCAAKALHCIIRVLLDDEAAVWKYVTNRLIGGPDHLDRFNY
ncbi:SIR2 family protein [Dyadobacter sp. CY326]|uniref:SIR2 family protein n=1 Tax=Dyadobacter sp. CY326 TaxID=2907300 RepID=UPI001F1CCA29|nr:SIR2 family protein [Dyadobacter sp. CY326]MCE7066670.1 SIR2 family protein [Dyadobacter sp. CY326]